MNEIKFAQSFYEVPVSPEAEGKWLREGCCRSDCILQDIKTVFELAETGNSERIWHSVQVKAGQFRQCDAVIEMGIGGTGNDFDVVSKFH